VQLAFSIELPPTTVIYENSKIRLRPIRFVGEAITLSPRSTQQRTFLFLEDQQGKKI